MTGYTYMSQEALEAVCDRNDERANRAGFLERNYEIGFAPSDFRNLVAILGWYYSHGPAVVDSDIQSAEDLPEWAGQLVSAIAGTLDVEMI